jgi:hypothetical protein
MYYMFGKYCLCLLNKNLLSESHEYSLWGERKAFFILQQKMHVVTSICKLDASTG